jgi:hypothetical protein
LGVPAGQGGLQLGDSAPQSLFQLAHLVVRVGLQLRHSLPVGLLLEVPSFAVSLILDLAKRAGPVFAFFKRDENRRQSAAQVIQRVLTEDNDRASGRPPLKVRQEPVARWESTEFAAREEWASRGRGRVLQREESPEVIQANQSRLRLGGRVAPEPVCDASSHLLKGHGGVFVESQGLTLKIRPKPPRGIQNGLVRLNGGTPRLA